MHIPHSGPWEDALALQRAATELELLATAASSVRRPPCRGTLLAVHVPGPELIQWHKPC